MERFEANKEAKQVYQDIANDMRKEAGMHYLKAFIATAVLLTIGYFTDLLLLSGCVSFVFWFVAYIKAIAILQDAEIVESGGDHVRLAANRFMQKEFRNDRTNGYMEDKDQK